MYAHENDLLNNSLLSNQLPSRIGDHSLIFTQLYTNPVIDQFQQPAVRNGSFQALKKIGQDRLILMLCFTVFLSYLPEAGEYSCFFVYLRLVSTNTAFTSTSQPTTGNKPHKIVNAKSSWISCHETWLEPIITLPFKHGFYLLSCVNCHISRLVDASQIRVSSSRSVKPLSPFGGLCIVQSSMMCCTDWFGAPHSHSEVDFRPHLFMASPNLPTPVRIRL